MAGRESRTRPYPTAQTSNGRALGTPGGRDPTSHEVFIFCGFAQASSDSIFIESGPKTAGIRTCLATQREISVLWGQKSCPFPAPSESFPPLPRSHPPHVVTLFKSFPEFVHTEKGSHVFLKKPTRPSLSCPSGSGAGGLRSSASPQLCSGEEPASFSWPLGRGSNLLEACLAFPRHGLCLAGSR